MTDDNSNNNELVDMNSDDLEAFENEFYGKEQPKETAEVEEEANEEELETEDNPLATDDDNEEDDDEEDEVDEPKPAKKSKKSAKERIDELTAARRESEREAAALRRELEELRRERNEVKEREEPKAAKPEAVANGFPQPDAVSEEGEPLYPLGEFDPAYIRDLTKYTIEQETKAAREQEAREAQEREIQEELERVQAHWAERVAEVEKELPDLREHISELTDTFQDIEPAYGEFLATTIMSSEYGPQIMYYLSQNIGEAQKIVASGPAAATLALGRLEAKFEFKAEETKRNKKVSNAPEPPALRVKGTDGRFTVRPDTDDLDAFEREFYKQK